METKKKQIIETVNKALDMMTEQEYDRVLGFSEGLAFAAERKQADASGQRGGAA